MVVRSISSTALPVSRPGLPLMALSQRPVRRSPRATRMVSSMSVSNVSLLVPLPSETIVAAVTAADILRASRKRSIGSAGQMAARWPGARG